MIMTYNLKWGFIYIVSFVAYDIFTIFILKFIWIENLGGIRYKGPFYFFSHWNLFFWLTTFFETLTEIFGGGFAVLETLAKYEEY